VPPDFLNSREDALLVWAVVIVGYAFFESPREIGGSFLQVVRAFLAPKLVLLFGGAALYCAVVIALASWLDLWHTSALKETIYWFVGSGLVLVGSATYATPDPGYFKRILRQALKVAIVIELIVNLYVFPLLVELVVVFVVLAFVAMQIVARHDPKIERTVRKVIDGVLIAIGLLFLAYFAVRAISDLDGFLTRENAERFLVVPALTVAFVPFLYGVAWASKRKQENLRRRFRERMDAQPSNHA